MPSLESRPLTYAWRLYAAWYAGYSVFPGTFPGSRPSQWQHTFINLFDAGNCHLRMGLAGKDICICLSGTPCFYQIPFQKDSAGACDYDPAGFIPFSSDRQFIQIFSLKKSLTLRSQISCALAPLAYIRFKRTWSRNPRRFSGSGSRSRTDTSLRVKIVLG